MNFLYHVAWKKKWSGLFWEWPSALHDTRLWGLMRTLRNNSFISPIFSHPWFLSFEVNDLSTTRKKRHLFVAFFQASESKRKRGARKGTACYFDLLSSRYSRTTRPPRAVFRFLQLRHLTSKVSMVTVVLVLPCHAIRQITRSKRLKTIKSKISQKTYGKWS